MDSATPPAIPSSTDACDRSGSPQQQQSPQGPQSEGECLPPTPLVSDVRLLRRTLENFYAKFNPANVPRVQEFLDRYRGREAQLVKDVEKKYEAQNVRLSNFMPPGGVSRPRAASSSPSMRPNSREHELDVSALPSLLLKAFAKAPGSDGPRKPPPSGGAASVTRLQPTNAPSPIPPHTSVDTPPSSAVPPPAPLPPLPPATEPSMPPEPAQSLDPLVAERDALLSEKAALARSVKTLQRRLDSQAAECASLETRRKEACRQSEALQRNLMTVMDRELTLHKKNEELEQRVATAEAVAAASNRERDEAVEARRVCEAQLQDTLGLQHLLIAQLHSLLIEGGVGQDPYQAEDGEALTEALEQHTAKQPAQDVGMASKDVGSVETAALRTSLAASRVELAHAFRSRAEGEERLREVIAEKSKLEKQVATLEAELGEEKQRGDQLTKALESAQREVAERVKSLEEYETALTQERQVRAGLEAQLEEARAVIYGAAKTRKELEGFCREFRKDVEAAASERVNQALSLSAMNMEDILSRQGSLLDLQKQLHDQEVESYKAEIIRLSQSLFESRRDQAYCEKQVAGLQSEVRKAADEVVRMRERCMAQKSQPLPSSGN